MLYGLLSKSLQQIKLVEFRLICSANESTTTNAVRRMHTGHKCHQCSAATMDSMSSQIKESALLLEFSSH